MRSHLSDRPPQPTLSTAQRKKGLEIEEDKFCRVIKNQTYRGESLNIRIERLTALTMKHYSKILI